METFLCILFLTLFLTSFAVPAIMYLIVINRMDKKGERNYDPITTDTDDRHLRSHDPAQYG